MRSVSALRNTGDAVERPLALAEQVLVLARRVSAANGVLTITAAYTGMRCAELAGLRDLASISAGGSWCWTRRLGVARSERPVRVRAAEDRCRRSYGSSVAISRRAVRRASRGSSGGGLCSSPGGWWLASVGGHPAPGPAPPSIATQVAGRRSGSVTREHESGDHYEDASVVKIDCSRSAPTDAERPAGDDHQQAV